MKVLAYADLGPNIHLILDADPTDGDILVVNTRNVPSDQPQVNVLVRTAVVDALCLDLTDRPRRNKVRETLDYCAEPFQTGLAAGGAPLVGLLVGVATVFDRVPAGL